MGEEMNKNKLKFNFHAPRGCRVMSGGFGATQLNIDDNDYTWSIEHKKWTKYENRGNHGCASNAPCKTFRAFKRMLRKNPHMIGNLIWCHKNEYFNIESVL